MRITVTDIPGKEDIVIEDSERVVLFAGDINKMKGYLSTSISFATVCIRNIANAIAEELGITEVKEELTNDTTINN